MRADFALALVAINSAGCRLLPVNPQTGDHAPAVVVAAGIAVINHAGELQSRLPLELVAVKEPVEACESFPVLVAVANDDFVFVAPQSKAIDIVAAQPRVAQHPLQPVRSSLS